MSEVSIQKLKMIVAKVRAPNTIDGGEDGSSDAADVVSTAAIEDSIPIDFKSKRRNTKVNCWAQRFRFFIFHEFININLLQQVMGMFEFLRSTFKKCADQKKSEEKSGEDTQSSSQDESIENRDVFVDPVIKRLKEAKVNLAVHLQCFRFYFEANAHFLFYFCARMYWTYIMWLRKLLALTLKIFWIKVKVANVKIQLLEMNYFCRAL